MGTTGDDALSFEGCTPERSEGFGRPIRMISDTRMPAASRRLAMNRERKKRQKATTVKDPRNASWYLLGIKLAN